MASNYANIKILTEMYTSVKDFWIKFEMPIKASLNDLNAANATLSANLIREEMQEFIDAKEEVYRLDAIVDWLYVSFGGMLGSGLNERQFDFVRLHDQRGMMELSASVIHAFEKRPLPCCATIQMRLPELCTALLVYGMKTWRMFDAAFYAVHDKNMKKVWTTHELEHYQKTFEYRSKKCGPDQHIVWRKHDGKLLKPPSFQPANLRPFLI